MRAVPCLGVGMAALVAVSVSSGGEAGAAPDMAAACRAAVNDDTVRDYQPALHDGAVAAFRKLFPGANAVPSEEELRSQARFRCMGGRVYVCFIGANLPCARINAGRRNPGADAYCKQNPNADFVPMVATSHDALYSYGCKAGKAVVTGSTYKLDARGFAKSLWTPMARPQR